MLIFLTLLFTFQLSLQLHNTQLEDINQQIAYLQQIDSILTQRRHSFYNYSQFDYDYQPIQITNNQTNKFSEGLTLQNSHPSGKKSFILFLKYNLYNAQTFQNQTKIYHLNGSVAFEIKGNIQFITIVKATIEYEICYLEQSLMTKCGIFDENLPLIKFKQVQLEPSQGLKLEKVKRYHVQKFQGNNLHTLLLENGQIRVYDGAGIQKPILKSSCSSIVKYLDHNPYPMIVGTDKIAFLQPFKPTQSSLGCPVIEGQIITAEVQTPFSNTFYLLTTTQIVVMQYSLKKSDRHCKISHRIPISSPSNNLKMFYPTLLFNDSYVNITDTLTPPQLPLSIPLCQQNQYDTQYRNNEYYLLHRCCNNKTCTSNIYMKSKRVNNTSSKHFKYVIFLIIFAILAVKFWNKKQSTEKSNPDVLREEQEDMDTDPMVKYQKRIHKEKLKKAKNM